MIKELTNEIDSKLGGEIKELKFGCRVITDKGENVTILGKGEGWLTYLDKDNLISHEEASGKPVEILGRPINLEDVMMAIKEIDKQKEFEIEQISGRKGAKSRRFQCFLGILYRYALDEYEFWTMGESLSLQSPETVEKIEEILNVK